MATLANNKRQRQKQSQQARRAYLQAQQRKAERRRKVLAGIALFLILGLVVGVFISTGGQEQEQEQQPAAPRPDCEPPATRIRLGTPPPISIDKARTYRATVETDIGSFTADLDDDKAPQTVNNFVFLSRYHYYDGVAFHRIIQGFVC